MIGGTDVFMASFTVHVSITSSSVTSRPISPDHLLASLMRGGPVTWRTKVEAVTPNMIMSPKLRDSLTMTSPKWCAAMMESPTAMPPWANSPSPVYF